MHDDMPQSEPQQPKYYEHEFPKLMELLTDKELLEIGRKVCSTDFAVRFYHKKYHPKFYKNRSALLHAVRRAFAVNFPEKKQYIREKVTELVEGREVLHNTGDNSEMK